MTLGLRPTVTIEQIVYRFRVDMRDAKSIPQNLRAFPGGRAPQIDRRKRKSQNETRFPHGNHLIRPGHRPLLSAALPIAPLTRRPGLYILDRGRDYASRADRSAHRPTPNRVGCPAD